MNSKTRIIISLVVLASIVGIFIIAINNSSSNNNGSFELSEEVFAMDTLMTLTINGADDDVLNQTMSEMRTLVYDMESKLSVTNKDSDISRINTVDGKAVEVSDETYEILEIATGIASETDGAFDPTIYPIVKLWGFTTDEQHVPSDADIDETLEYVDYTRIHLLGNNTVQLDKGVELDLGGCAKGYLSDRLCDIIRDNNLSGIVSLGGNVSSVGTKYDGGNYRVGISDPDNPNKIYARKTSLDEAVITSGDYQRFFEENGKKYHHIFDSSTGKPAETGLSSVTVIGADGVYCDAYATALYVMGEDKAFEFIKAHPQYKIFIIRRDGSCVASDGLDIEKV